MDMSLSKLQELVMDREAWGPRGHRVCDRLVGPDQVGLVGPMEDLRLSFEDCRVEGGLQAFQFTRSVMSDSL